MSGLPFGEAYAGFREISGLSLYAPPQNSNIRNVASQLLGAYDSEGHRQTIVSILVSSVR